jgi:Zn ribbon nucleic-acid-binding protein
MEGLKCPKCGSTDTSHWNNKKGQTVGHCNGCGKWVTFAKSEEGSNKDQTAQTSGSRKDGNKGNGKRSSSSANRTGGRRRASGTGPEPVRTGKHSGEEGTGANSGGLFRTILDFKLF